MKLDRIGMVNHDKNMRVAKNKTWSNFLLSSSPRQTLAEAFDAPSMGGGDIQAPGLIYCR